MHEVRSGAIVAPLSEAAKVVGNRVGSIGTKWLRKSWVQRALIVLASLAFLHVFPTLLFVVYMAEHGIFDYAFFREGPFAMGVFYGTAELLLILASLTLFGVTVALPGWYRTRKVEWLLASIALVALNGTALVAVVTAVAKSDSGSLTDGLVFLALCLLVAVHLAVTINGKPRTALLSLLALFSATACITVLRPQAMTSVLGWGLSVYNVGGSTRVRIAHDERPFREGQLVFLGPDRLYVRHDGDSSVTILERGPSLRLALLGKRDKSTVD
jgi:hypothetical protein